MPTSLSDNLDSWILVMDGLKKICKEQNNGRYFVRRGPVDWSSFNFENHAFAISILCDDRTFLRAINTATITLEIFQKMPTEASTDVSETGLSQMSQDAKAIILKMLQLKRQNGDALVTRFHKDSDTLIESSDVSLKIQGAVVSIKVDIAE